jgi:hypothetical protein
MAKKKIAARTDIESSVDDYLNTPELAEKPDQTNEIG